MEKNKEEEAREDIRNFTYEQAFAELERIVGSLENEAFALEETMALYERGQLLVKRCEELLEKADLRLQVLGDDTMPFEGDEDESNVP